MLKKFVVYLLTTIVLGSGFQVGAVATVQRHSDQQLATITRKSVAILTNYHYRKRNLDNKFSQQLFDEYFQTLDPTRIYFTQKDVDRFKIWRNQLSTALRLGDNRFAFAVYSELLRRHREYVHYTEEMLKKPLDFTTNERMLLDRTKAPRCKNDAELHELWRLKNKNDVLVFKLYDRMLRESTKKADRKILQERIAWHGDCTPQQQLLKRLKDFENEIQKRDRIDILGIYLNTVAELFGPHSNYLPPRMDEDFEINMSLSLCGIGATLTSDDGYIKIVELVKGSPAALCKKLKVNDRIIAVTQEDGETRNVVNMPLSQAVQLIRGPENSKLTLTILSGSRQARPQKVTLTRAKVKLVENEAKSKIIKRNGKRVGVIMLPSFYMDFAAVLRGDADAKRCSRDVRKILERFNRLKVDAVVLDLRRNGGGSLPEAIALAGLFIKTGPVVQVRYARDLRLEFDDNPEQLFQKPMVILTSKLSASASEIVTAALRDCNRALVVGDSRTFGKGTVLQVEELSRPSFFRRATPSGSLTFEIALFYRTAGGSVQQLGITPDIKLPSLTEEFKVGEMFMDNHLPWDSINPVNRDKYFNFEPQLPALRQKSQQRIAGNLEYQQLLRRVKLFRQYKDRKTISLNESERWKDYLKEKQLADAEEKEMLDKHDEDDKNLPDPILTESTYIASDLATALEQQATK